MGIGVWLGTGIIAAVIARFIPFRRGSRRLVEWTVAVITALLAGLIATALDFGGWNEPDWRAGLFTFAAALAVVGWMRAAPGLVGRA